MIRMGFIAEAQPTLCCYVLQNDHGRGQIEKETRDPKSYPGLSVPVVVHRRQAFFLRALLRGCGCAPYSFCYLSPSFAVLYGQTTVVIRKIKIKSETLCFSAHMASLHY